VFQQAPLSLAKAEAAVDERSEAARKFRTQANGAMRSAVAIVQKFAATRS
jgi:hypothetical protein